MTVFARAASNPDPIIFAGNGHEMSELSFAAYLVAEQDPPGVSLERLTKAFESAESGLEALVFVDARE